MRIAIIVVCGLLIVTAAWTLSVDNSNAMARTIQPGVVVGDERAYAMHPDGGVLAIEVSSGDVAWHSKAAGRPLHVDDGRLLAQVDSQSAGVLELAVLAAPDGSLISPLSVKIADVVPRVTDGLTSRFEITPIDTRGTVQLHWKSTQTRASGADTGGDNQAEVSLGGVAVDLSKGAVKALPAAEVPTQFSRPPIQAQILDDVEGRQFLSADQKHVLVSTKNPKDAWNRYAWSVYTVEGRQLGTATSYVAFAPFLVLDDTLLFVSPVAQRAGATPGEVVELPLSLKAVNLRDGAERWSQPIRDVKYRGPMPS